MTRERKRMHGRIEDGVTRVVGVVALGESGESGRFAVGVAAAMATTGTRVAIGSLGASAEVASAVLSDADRHGLVPITLPSWIGETAEAQHALRAAIEAHGRTVQRIVLDLGAPSCDAALAVGPAADDVVCVVEATRAGADAASAFVTHLGCRGVDDDVLLVVRCRAAADARETIRAIWSTTSERGPRLVLAGVVPTDEAIEAVGDLADVIAAIAGRLLVPRSASLRGGMQFFLENRIALGRGGV